MLAIKLTSTSSGVGGDNGGGVRDKLLQNLQDHLRVHSLRPKLSQTHQSLTQNPSIEKEAALPYGLPIIDLIEPQTKSYLKSIDFIETFVVLYRKIESCPQFEKTGIYLK